MMATGRYIDTNNLVNSEIGIKFNEKNGKIIVNDFD